MATQVGEAIVKLSFDDDQAKKDMSKAKGHLDSFADSAAKTIKGIGIAFTAAFAAATTAAVKFSKDSIQAYNAQEKALTDLETAATMHDWTPDAVEGLKEYNAELQKYGVIGDEVNAAAQSNFVAMGLSYDAITELTPALDDLLVKNKGLNATMEDASSMATALGKAIETGSTARLVAQGVVLSDVQKEMFKYADAEERAKILSDAVWDSIGDLNVQMSGTFQGKIKQLSNNFGDLQESFGAFLAGKGDLDTLLSTLDTVVNQAIDLIVTMAPQIIEGITRLITEIAKQLPGIISTLLPTIISALNQLLVAWYEIQPLIIQMLIDSIPVLIDGFMELLNALIQAIPTIIPQLVEAITNLITTIALQLTRPDFLATILKAGFTLLMSLVRAIPQMLTALITALPQIITNIVNFLLDPNNLMMIINAAIQLFLGLVMAVPQILGALLGAFGELVGNLWNGITSMFGQFAANFGEFIGGIFKNAINGVLTFIENFINAPIDLLNGFIGLINDAFGWIGVNLGKIDRINLPRLAQGGIALNATTAIIGEEGKEAVLPLENNTDNWAGLLARTLVTEMDEQQIGGSGITVYMNNEINSKLDAQEIGRLMIQSIRRAA